MRDFCYIVVTRNGIDRMNKRDVPQLKTGERVFKVAMEVPDEHFAPKTIPSVTLEVPPPVAPEIPNPVVDVNEPNVRGLHEAYRKQVHVNTAAARLLKVAISSGDPETTQAAIEILQAMKEEGIDVRVEGPSIPEELQEEVHD